MSATRLADDDRLERVRAQWRAIIDQPSPVPGWQARLDTLRDEVGRKRARGEWLGGPRTLMKVLGVQHHEVRLCAGLAWLLRPDGFHMAGTAFLERLLELDGLPNDIPPESLTHAHVVTEERRHGPDGKLTKADIVVTVAGRTILFEAKVAATEQPRQLDRLADLWSVDEPVLIFLTSRRGQTPVTARESQGRWLPLTWPEIADAFMPVVHESALVSAGARELVETMQVYGGGDLVRG